MSGGAKLDVTLVTGYTSDNSIRLKMSKKVVENQFAYANRQGYHYLEYKENLAVGYEPYWSKIKIINDWLDKNKNDTANKWLVWLDDDMIIMDSSIKVEDLVNKYARHGESIIVAKDAISWNNGDPETSINTGMLFVKNTQESRNFFQEVWKQKDKEFTYFEDYTIKTTTLGQCKDQKCLHEQAAMANLLENQEYISVINQRNQDNIGINSFIRERQYFSQRSGKPYYSDYNNDPLSSVASPGDFAAQCTGIPIQGKRDASEENDRYLRLETAEVILNCVTVLTDEEKKQLREETNFKKLSPLLQEIREAFRSREFSKRGALDTAINKILARRRIYNAKQFLQNKIAKAKADLENLDLNASNFDDSKDQIIQELTTEWQQEYNELIEAIKQGISIKDNAGNKLDGDAALIELNVQKNILNNEDLKVFKVDYKYKHGKLTETISIDCSDEKVEEVKEQIIATEIFDSIFAEVADNSNRIGSINKILLDLKSNVNKVLNGKLIENEEKIRSIVKRLLESKLSILVKTKEAADTAANNFFTKHTQKFKENKINIEQEIKKAPNIVKKLSDPNIDFEFFTKNYADALQRKLDQARLAARTTELHKESKETKATATKASASSTQPKQPRITVAQEQHKKNTSSLQDEIEKIIEAIKRSQTIDNVIDIINTQIKDILTRMSLEEKEKYFTNQISYAITDRSIKFLNDTTTPRQVFDLLPKIVEIKNSAILTSHDEGRLMATRDQEIRNKGKKTR